MTKLNREDIDFLTTEQEFDSDSQRLNELSNTRVSKKEIRTKNRRDDGELVGGGNRKLHRVR